MDIQLLTQKEFDIHRAQKTLRVSFVGMSNSGKSYRARVLSTQSDFLWYQVDDDIQKELGFIGQEDISAWLGFPTSKTYAERERTYLDLEEKYTSTAAMSSHGKNLVFDTTGSVVHLSPKVHATLREHTLVVHLDVGDDSLEEMLIRFFKDPKPLAWSGFFTQKSGESLEDAVRHSYPLLLAERLARYRTLAHLNIDAHALYDLSGEDTLTYIRSRLPS